MGIDLEEKAKVAYMAKRQWMQGLSADSQLI
jgi:hypothetical protein